MTYPQMPVSVPLSSGSSYSSLGYGGSDLLSGAQDIPRATYDNSYTTPSTSTSYTATASAYPQLGYAQSLHQHQHQQHQQQQRKGSDQYVTPIQVLVFPADHPLPEMIIRAQQMPASESSMRLEVC
jgi:hypothetical protein